MKRIGIFYGSSTGNCQTIADLLKNELGEEKTDIFDVAFAKPTDLNKYDNLIFGISTWGSADLQEDWMEFLSGLDSFIHNGKKIALYGLGDQHTYSDTFADGMGILYEWLIARNCHIVGHWPVDGYNFKNSKALKNGKFVGLVIDEDVQFKYSSSRVKKWVEILRNEFS